MNKQIKRLEISFQCGNPYILWRWGLILWSAAAMLWELDQKDSRKPRRIIRFGALGLVLLISMQAGRRGTDSGDRVGPGPTGSSRSDPLRPIAV